MDIAKDPILLEFIENRNLSDGTELRYIIMIKDYCTYINLTPTQLIEQAEMEEEKGIRLRQRKIKTYLIGFKNYLREKDYSELTIQNTISTIRSMYHEFQIELPYTRSKRRYVKKQSKEDLPNKDHIIQALRFCNLKYQAIILLMSSSGMGASEVCNLMFTDFLDSIKKYINGSTNVEEIQSILSKKVEDNELIISTWNIRRVKTKMSYTTFSTYESIEAILLYLESSPAIEDDYLFRSQQSDKQIPTKTFTNQFNIINSRADFGKVDRQIFFRSHNLRKFFTNALHKNKVTKERIDWMLGHSIDSTSASYFKSDIEDLKSEYIRCIKDLTMGDVEVDYLISEDKKELRSLRREVQEMREIMKQQKLLDKLPPKE